MRHKTTTLETRTNLLLMNRIDDPTVPKKKEREMTPLLPSKWMAQSAPGISEPRWYLAIVQIGNEYCRRFTFHHITTAKELIITNF